MAELRRLLIANRGEIAVRIVRACRESGVSPVVAVTPGERRSPSAEAADALVEIGSYLDAESIVEAASRAEADAVHPGYGFLAEDPTFADLVLGAGLTWVGPPPEAMRALGDKLAAREVARAVGVPVVPGLDIAGLDEEALAQGADRLGVPLLVKAAAGGGGRGMRTVDDLGEVHAMVAAARREAGASFGDGRVFLERRLDRVRHVEVQVLADTHGHVVHLGERDCSLQRRHQKIVESAPAPGVDEALRAELGDAAISIAERAGYRGAGTAEFLLDEAGSWWFLEMNTRLQVEHPVTEVVTGVDLVRAQLSIAAGSPLALDPDDLALRGHAIEARVYAEDPAAGFLPTGGTVDRLELPHWPGVRIDTALREGDVVGTGFDPLLAKVIAWDEDRPHAIARLRAALAEVVVLGVPTNLGFLLDVLGRPEVIEGTADTDWVEATWTPAVPPLPDGVRVTTDPTDPWSVFGSRADPPRGVAVAARAAQYRGWAYPLGDEEIVAGELAATDGALVAPMPSTVLSVDVAIGDEVAAGQAVAQLEAMKIQVQVSAPSAGIVRSVHVRAGDVVGRGAPLIELEES
jgi:acetyl-CoA/propionyl-CoA carboxylase biotin carboxyl carrier protein